MFKLILLFTALSVMNIASAQDMQVYMTNVTDTGTAALPILTTQYQSYPDSSDHANTVIPCTSPNCNYGLFYRYKRNLGDIPFVACVRLKSDSFCYTVPINNNGTSQTTYAEANKKFIDAFGASGSIRMSWYWRPIEWEICFGSSTANNVAGSHPVMTAYPGSCQPITIVPVSCDISSDALNLEHGIVNTTELNSANTPKSTTAFFNLSCNRNASVTFNITQPEISLTTGLKANLTLKLDGQSISLGDSQSINSSNHKVDITSTLQATGKIAPNIYSGSTVLIININ